MEMNQMCSLARIAVAGFYVLSFTTFVLAQRQTENYSGRTVAAREVLVSFRPMSQQVLTQLIQAHDLDLMRPVGKAGALRLRSRRMDVDALIRALSTHPNVLFVEPNYVIRAIGVPNDPGFPLLWGLQNTGQVVGGDIGELIVGPQSYAVSPLSGSSDSFTGVPRSRIAAVQRCLFCLRR